MANYDYKCVPVPRTLFTGKVGKDPHITAVEAYENLIKESSKGGWELDHFDTITSVQAPGCLSGLFGKKAEEVNYKLIILRKEI